MLTDFTVTVEEVNDLKGRYKVVLSEAEGVTVFCDTGSEVFGVISGFCQKGLISARHPVSIMMGPFVDPSSQEFQAKYKEGKRLRAEFVKSNM